MAAPAGTSSGPPGGPPAKTWRQRVRPYFTLWRSRYDLQLSAPALLYFLVCSYITCLSNSVVDRINPNSVLPVDERKPLIDPLQRWSFQVFVRSGLPNDFSDWMVRASAVLIFARILTLKSRAATVFRRTMYISGTVYLLRAPTVLMTILPNPYLTCDARPDPNLFWDAFLLFTQTRFSCGDVFFSGHSIFFTMVARLYLMYSDNYLLRVFAVLFTALALYSLIFTTYHYSIDVVFAFCIVVTLFSIYHWIAKGKMGRNRWWGRIVLFVDGEAELNRREGLPPFSRSHGRDSDSLPFFSSDSEGDYDSTHGGVHHSVPITAPASNPATTAGYHPGTTSARPSMTQIRSMTVDTSRHAGQQSMALAPLESRPSAEPATTAWSIRRASAAEPSSPALVPLPASPMSTFSFMQPTPDELDSKPAASSRRRPVSPQRSAGHSSMDAL
ncbi:hypothetical protein H9P43_010197 [Blastocladiella emersonii ATCC 22665]|nr:hypothetical protein H9P43_010197 [Blastocladiella emersonii ATCC 22665]